MRKLFGVFATVVLLPLSLPRAAAAQVMLDFEGIGDFNPVGNYYNGYAFFGTAIALERVGYLVTDPCQGSAGFPLPPSGCAALFFYTSQTGSNAGINVATGFTSGFSFFYYPQYLTTQPASFTVFSGANGTGTPLATLGLSKPPFGTPAPWQPAGVSFAGTAQSILFTNAGGSLVFDNVTFGSDTPIVEAPEDPGHVTPEPVSLALLGTGLAGIAVAARRRRQLSSLA